MSLIMVRPYGKDLSTGPRCCYPGEESAEILRFAQNDRGKQNNRRARITGEPE
jgi:hypothetical protein